MLTDSDRCAVPGHQVSMLCEKFGLQRTLEESHTTRTQLALELDRRVEVAHPKCIDHPLFNSRASLHQ